MYKYEELNDAKDSRPFPLLTHSTHKRHNELTDAVGYLVNDRFIQAKDRHKNELIWLVPRGAMD